MRIDRQKGKNNYGKEEQGADIKHAFGSNGGNSGRERHLFVFL